MSSDSPHLISAVQGLLDRRAELTKELAQIDARLNQIEAVLAGAIASPAIQKTPNWPPKIDGRRAGSFVEWIVDTLNQRPEGLTRKELKGEALRHPTFGPKLTRNENAFYNSIKRLVSRNEIAFVGARLYAAKHVDAAVAQTSEAPEVVSLFPRGGANGG